MSKNMHSASEHPEPVNAYVESELSVGRMVQVAADTLGLRISQFGVIPKPHKLGRWMVNTDLSSPKGGSVNDGVPGVVLNIVCFSGQVGEVHPEPQTQGRVFGV